MKRNVIAGNAATIKRSDVNVARVEMSDTRRLRSKLSHVAEKEKEKEKGKGGEDVAFTFRGKKSHDGE